MPPTFALWLEAFFVTRSHLPLAPGTDWSHIEYTDEYIAILELPMSPDYQYVAVRGGRTLGHWSNADAETAGRRLQEEVAGRYCGTLMANVWAAWANPACSRREPLTVAEFLFFSLPAEESLRTYRQYQKDPLIAGPSVSGV